MNDRLSVIERRLKRIPLSPQRFEVGDPLPGWLVQAMPMNQLRTLLLNDVPWLIARVKELERATQDQAP